MRYTRNRQLLKSNKDYFNLAIKKNFTIDSMRSEYIADELDYTFKWHREHDYGENYIEFGDYCLKARLNYSK